MKPFARGVLAAAALSFAFFSIPSSMASGGTLRLEFDAGGFSDAVDSTEPPVDHVHGVITYRMTDDPSIEPTVSSLLSISLTIGSHTYSLSEIGFVRVHSRHLTSSEV